MMAQKALHMYYSNDHFQAIDMPYGQRSFTMTIFLPSWEIDLDAFIATMEPDSLQYWISHFHSDTVDVYLPRFTLEYELSLKDALTALGMGIAFAPYEADFAKMYKDGNIYISEVRHKTFVKVNEEGTEAAAVTSVEMGTTSADPDMPITFRADHPFVFIIRENESGTILFIGKIVDPPQE
jgi:serpin B